MHVMSAAQISHDMIEAREAHDNIGNRQTELQRERQGWEHERQGWQRERQGWEQEREEWQAKLGNEASANSQLMQFKKKVSADCSHRITQLVLLQSVRLDEVQAQLCSLTAELADTEVPAVLNRAVS